MPRKNGMYRTIKMCDVECICLDIKKQESYKEVLRTFYIADREKLFKRLSSDINNKSRKLVHISKVKPIDIKYFISLADFLKYATPEREE